eukprot:29493-Pelagococcus_subviridis.AAC.6
MNAPVVVGWPRPLRAGPRGSRPRRDARGARDAREGRPRLSIVRGRLSAGAAYEVESLARSRGRVRGRGPDWQRALPWYSAVTTRPNAAAARATRRRARRDLPRAIINTTTARSIVFLVQQEDVHREQDADEGERRRGVLALLLRVQAELPPPR